MDLCLPSTEFREFVCEKFVMSPLWFIKQTTSLNRSWRYPEASCVKKMANKTCLIFILHEIAYSTKIFLDSHCEISKLLQLTSICLSWDFILSHTLLIFTRIDSLFKNYRTFVFLLPSLPPFPSFLHSSRPQFFPSMKVIHFSPLLKCQLATLSPLVFLLSPSIFPCSMYLFF